MAKAPSHINIKYPKQHGLVRDLVTASLDVGRISVFCLVDTAIAWKRKRHDVLVTVVLLVIGMKSLLQATFMASFSGSTAGSSGEYSYCKVMHVRSTCAVANAPCL